MHNALRMHMHIHMHMLTHTLAHMHMHAYTHTHTYTRTHMHTRTRAHAHTHAHTGTHTHAHTRARTHAHRHTHPTDRPRAHPTDRPNPMSKRSATRLQLGASPGHRTVAARRRSVCEWSLEDLSPWSHGCPPPLSARAEREREREACTAPGSVCWKARNRARCRRPPRSASRASQTTLPD